MSDILLNFDIGNGETQFYICDEDANTVKHLNIVMDELYNKKCYDAVDVKGKDVVDIGGYLGDSAVYFSKRGANRVIVFEPYNSYNYIDRNAKLNHCDNILSVNAAVGKSGIGMIDSHIVNNGATQMGIGVADKPILSLTLDDIVRIFKIKDAVLKLDCEGCEFNCLINCLVPTVRKFKEIILEYHSTPTSIVESLWTCGFSILSNEKLYSNTGLIHAVRID